MKRLTGDQICRRFSPDDPPALVVKPGETFIIETTDRFQSASSTNFSPGPDSLINTMNGPVFIEGVKAGSTLRIELLKMDPGADLAYVIALPGAGPLGNRITRFCKETVRIVGPSVVFSSGVSLPLRPMLGRIGVAPLQGSASLDDMGAFGGLLSNTDVTEGSSLYLPVFHDGAFLCVGDSHLAMGDGEATSSAVEGALRVRLRACISDDVQVSHPLVVTSSHLVTCGRGPTMEEATRAAVEAMAELVVERLGIDHTQAAMVLGCGADVRACLALYPPYSMKVMLPRSVLRM